MAASVAHAPELTQTDDRHPASDNGWRLSSRPRVALACPGVGLVQRGFERMFSDLFHLLEGDLDVTLFKGGGPVNDREKVLRFASRNGRLCKWFPLHAMFGRTALHSECATFAMAMVPHLRSGRYDVVHCIDPPLAKALYRLRAWLHLPFRLLYTEGCAQPPCYYPKCDFIHHVSQAPMDQALAYGISASKMRLVPSGVHADHFQSAVQRDVLRARYNVGADTFLILSVAALNRRQKRVDHVINEVAKLDGEFLLWLDGSMDHGDPDLPQMAKDKLGDRCRITHVPTENVRDLYRMADVKVLASEFESFGAAAAEAAAAGTPVLIHDSPHFQWLLPNPRCHLDMTQPGALAARLAHLRDHPQELESLKCAEFARGRYDWHNIKGPYMRLYQDVAQLALPSTA